MGANSSFPDRQNPGGEGSRPPGMSVVRYAPSLSPENENAPCVRDKKKKASKLATLRKKLSRARRHSRSLDHGKAIRELTGSWTIRELNALVEEYEASIVLKELAIFANLARPHANTIKEDLSHLYDFKYCTDVDLIYQGTVFPIHRAILSVRCPYFRELLAHYPEYGSQVPVHIRTPGIDVHMFSSLLRYLYTGEFLTHEARLNNIDVIQSLCREFGTPNPLEQDLRTLLESSEYSDTVLLFASDLHCHDPITPEDEMGGAMAARACSSKPVAKNELKCHKAILAARSPFFRNVLLRRARSGEELTERALHSHSCIVLDETVIPKQYARVLLHALYLDTVDLSNIVHPSSSTCSLSEVQAMVAGKAHLTHVDEAMEIYQIGQFLDLPVLSQGCEDIIVVSLNVDNLVSVLMWSSEPHGSQWVHRQTLHYLREEFVQVAHSPVLFDLSRDHLIAALRSNFLQAGEQDVLTAVIRWGEHQLMKRMEEREPNLLSHTAHSVTKKGIKKRDLNDTELREMLTDLLPYVRTDHIIPANSDVLSSSIKRGLISTPPSHMIADEGNTSTASAWVRGKNNGIFQKPRLFLPYYEETKALLDEQLSQVQENELVRLRMVHMSAIPDTLYMVEDRTYSTRPHSTCIPSSSSTVDIIAGTIPVPDQKTHKMMCQREHELHHTKLAQRAFSLPCTDRRAVFHQIALRVVREFGLPDSTVEVLSAAKFTGSPGLSTSQMYGSEEGLLSEARYHSPQRVRYHHHNHPHLHHVHHRTHSASHSQPYCPEHSREKIYAHPSPMSTVRGYNSQEKESGACSDSLLSEMMPDIAMATATLNQMTLHDLERTSHQQECQLDLDLGDGNNHSNNSTLYI